VKHNSPKALGLCRLDNLTTRNRSLR